MKARSFVSAALALMIAAPIGAHAAKLGKPCGGFAGLQCGKGEFCQFKPGTCGLFDQMGTCTRMPRFCTKIFRPVCGCDGKTYGNDCDRQAAGVSKRSDGKCAWSG